MGALPEPIESRYDHPWLCSDLQSSVPQLPVPMRETDLYPAVHDYLEQRFLDRLRPAYGDLRSISAVTATAGGTGSAQFLFTNRSTLLATHNLLSLEWISGKGERVRLLD